LGGFFLPRKVVIVGGGPSGASCAYTIAKAGLPVIVIEKSRPPRDKLCGGGLTQKTLRFLRARNLLRDDLIRSECYEMENVFANGSVISIESSKPIVSVVHRNDFDKHLLDSAGDAGAEISTEESFRGVELGETLTVRTNKRNISADYLVGADGVNSSVAKSAMLWEHWPTLRTALGIECDVPIGDFNPQKVRVRFGDYMGYIWEFPRGEVLDVGLIGDMSDASLPGRIQSFMQFNGYTGRIKGWHLPVAGVGRMPTATRNRVLLVGDASGAVDPWFGEGIYYALLSGEQAAHSIIAGSNAQSTYQASYRKFWNDMVWAKRFAQLFFNHNSFVPFFLANDKKLQSLLIQLLSGEISFRELFIRTTLRAPTSAAKFWLNRAIPARS